MDGESFWLRTFCCIGDRQTDREINAKKCSPSEAPKPGRTVMLLCVYFYGHSLVCAVAGAGRVRPAWMPCPQESGDHCRVLMAQLSVPIGRHLNL